MVRSTVERWVFKHSVPLDASNGKSTRNVRFHPRQTLPRKLRYDRLVHRRDRDDQALFIAVADDGSEVPTEDAVRDLHRVSRAEVGQHDEDGAPFLQRANLLQLSAEKCL